MHCRLHKLRFAGDDPPDFSDILGSMKNGRCRACVFPGRPGSSQLGLCDEDMELNQEDERAVHRGFFVGICKDHAEVVFERAVKSRVCQGPGCNPIREMEQPNPGLGTVRIADDLGVDVANEDRGARVRADVEDAGRAVAPTADHLID